MKVKTCKTCARLIKKKGYYPTCQFISNFIRDTYYAPDNKFAIHNENFGCNQWEEKGQIIKQYKDKFIELIKEIKNEKPVFMQCNEEEYPKIIRAINSINNIFEEYLISDFHKKQKGITIWKN